MRIHESQAGIAAVPALGCTQGNPHAHRRADRCRETRHRPATAQAEPLRPIEPLAHMVTRIAICQHWQAICKVPSQARENAGKRKAERCGRCPHHRFFAVSVTIPSTAACFHGRPAAYTSKHMHGQQTKLRVSQAQSTRRPRPAKAH